jgi:two-component system, cell cycle response regulator DivK
VEHTDNSLQVFRILRNSTIHLIIMDIKLPMVSGLELAHRIKEDEYLKNIPIVAVTAFAMKGDRERIIGAGCDAYISKPIDMKIFLQTVGKFLDGIARDEAGSG